MVRRNVMDEVFMEEFLGIKNFPLNKKCNDLKVATNIFFNKCVDDYSHYIK